jgi:hypothetical protein
MLCRAAQAVWGCLQCKTANGFANKFCHWKYYFSPGLLQLEQVGCQFLLLGGSLGCRYVLLLLITENHKIANN